MKKHYPVILFLIFYVAIFGYKLISKPAPFYDWDESIYAEVGREMVDSGSLTPRWNFQTWLDKPPLVPLFYGTLMKVTPFIQPEISTRIVTLLLATTVLAFVYLLYYRVLKDSLLTTLVVVITSFTSIILQRALVLNIDIFLLVGWLGYVLFYKRFWLSTFFLAVAVLSKSLLGFYAPGIMFLYYLYLFLTKDIKRKELIQEIKKISLQVGLLSLWYVVMLMVYGKDFWIQHIYESHTKRVTASIESHFGKRTYYIDLLYEYFGYIWSISLGGLGLILWHWWKKKIKIQELLYGLFLLPWFLFLNLTKTKIFWYSHPYIPQFAFLIVYPLTFLKKINKYVYIAALVIVFIATFNYYFGKKRVYAVEYATRGPHHDMAEFAKTRCDKLIMLMDPTEREKIATLRSMDLTITTTTWWGQHPSMVYYFGKKINFIYELDEFQQKIQNPSKKTCITLTEQDKPVLKQNPNYTLLNEFGTVYLYRSKVK